MNIPSAKLENFVVPEKEVNGKACMKSVWLDVEGGRLLATDGHMAARVTIGVDKDDVSGMVPVEAFELARKELKIISKILGKDTIPDPQLKVTAGEDAVVIENLLTTTSHIVKRPRLVGEEKFPNIDAIMPKLNRKPNVSLAAGYVADIVKSLDGDGLSLWVDGEESCVTMASPAGKAVVVVMPRREAIDVDEINQRGACKTDSAAAGK